MLKRLALAFALLVAPVLAFAQAPPPVPVIPDANRYDSFSPVSSTSVFNVSFPVFGSCEDLTVQLNGTPLTYSSQWTCASASGTALANLPLPITDMQVTLVTPISSGFLEIIGNWQPRRTTQPTNPAINRYEMNESLSTVIAGMRELHQQELPQYPQTAGYIPIAPGSGGQPVWGPVPPASPSTAPTNEFANGVDASGHVLYAQPSVDNLSNLGTNVDAALKAALNGSGGLLGYGAPATGVNFTSPGTSGIAKGADWAFTQIQLDVDGYGADPTGTNDSAPAWQAAINEAQSLSAAGGGSVTVYGCGNYRLNSTIVVSVSGVTLKGCGADQDHNVTFTQVGTRLFWGGSAGGTVVQFAYTGGSSAYGRNRGGLKQIKIDGISSAGVDLDVVNWYGGDFEDITLYNPESGGKALWTQTNSSGGDTPGTQMNRFKNITIRTVDVANSTATGMLLDSDGTTFAGNTSFNTFENIDITTVDGAGIDCKFCDNNTFINTRTEQTGTGVGVLLEASSQSGYTFGGANANAFYHLSAGSGGVTSQGTGSGTYAASQNEIIGYDNTNGAPEPTIGTGSTLVVLDTDPTWKAWTPTYGACTPGATPPTFASVAGSVLFKKGQNSDTHFSVSFEVTANGTGAGCLQFSLPTATSGPAVFSGRETADGRMLFGYVASGSSTVNVYFYDSSYPGISSDFYTLSGEYYSLN